MVGGFRRTQARAWESRAAPKQGRAAVRKNWFSRPRVALLALLGGLFGGAAQAVDVPWATPGSYTYTVPAGLTFIKFALYGAGGGGGGADSGAPGGSGGKGQYVSGSATVSGGQQYTLIVGGGGGNGIFCNGGADGGAAGTSAWAAGGKGGAEGYCSGSGGGGGGATALMLGTTTLAVAAGGGGGNGGAWNVGAAAGRNGGASDNDLLTTSPGGAGVDFPGDGGGGGGGGGGYLGGKGGHGTPDNSGASVVVPSGGSGYSAGLANVTVTAGGGSAGGAGSGGAGSGAPGGEGKIVLTLPALVNSIALASPNPTTPKTQVSWTVTFNTVVTGVDAGDFSLVPGGGVYGNSITSVSGSGTTWTVTAYTGPIGSGTLGLNLVDNDSIVETATGLPLGYAGAGNANFSGAFYTVVTPPVLAKTASNPSVALGSAVAFTITATNPYDGPIANVVMTDVLPTGLAYTTGVATLGSVAANGQTVTWTVPQLPAGGSAQLMLAVTPSATGTYVNTVTSPNATPASATLVVLPKAAVNYRMDENVGSWTGAANEVIDSGGSGINAKRYATATPTATNTVLPSPTIASQYPSVVGSFCNAASFDGKAAIQAPNNTVFNYTTQLSASAWIYPTAYPSSDLYTILSNDVNYEFHLDINGKLYWWWQYSTLTSAKQIPLNQWTHIAIAFNSVAGRQLIYINGVPDTNTNSWKGTLLNNTAPFYVGSDMGSGGAPYAPRNFHGMIDEVKLYNFEMSADQVKADMTLGRLCSGSYDHIQIEHSGTASMCGADTVVVKACLDPACSTLYTGNVTVQLSPSGWSGGDVFVISGGVAIRQITFPAAGVYTLGTVSAAPSANNTTRCLVGSTQNCTVNVSASTCGFDAVEAGAAPHTDLFTKLAGVPFNVDVLALNTSTTVNTAYTGIVNVDLVDASQTACPTGAGLTSATQLTYDVNNAGRKPLSFTYANAARNVRVRATVGTAAPSCSSDAFTIRPQGFNAVSSTAGLLSVTAGANADAAGASASATPAVKTGAEFNLTADTGIAGYDGTPKVDNSQTEWSGAPSAGRAAPGVGSVSGQFGAASPSTGNGASGNFTYDEIGYFRFKAGGIYDDSFTANSGDPGKGDCTNDFSNSLVDGRYGCKFGNTAVTDYFGRFIPDHFDTTVTQACVAGAFTYAGQPFALSVAAKNGAGVVTQNYAGSFARDVSLIARDAADKGNNPGPGALLPASIAAAVFAHGVASATPAYAFTSAQTAPTVVRLRASESEVSSLNGSEGTVAVRSGRVRLTNAYGSELLGLPLPIALQYWSGASGWQTNTADTCTVIHASDFAFNGYNLVTECGTAIMLAGIKPNYTVKLAPPGWGKTGWTEVTLNLGASPAGKQCGAIGSIGADATTANAPWLQYNWRGTIDNPKARATFGVYRSGPVIYRREIF